MHASARDVYLETQINTATPQRLRPDTRRDGAKNGIAQDAFREGRIDDGKAAVGHCRDIVSELIAGISPEASPLASQILGVYMYLLTTLVESQFTRDIQRLADVIRVSKKSGSPGRSSATRCPTGQRQRLLPSPRKNSPRSTVAEAWTPGCGATRRRPKATAGDCSAGSLPAAPGIGSKLFSTLGFGPWALEAFAVLLAFAKWHG